MQSPEFKLQFFQEKVKFEKDESAGPVEVTHICNPNYLGGKGQEVGGLRPTQAKSLKDPISTNKS
jgi:hypothetical protein